MPFLKASKSLFMKLLQQGMLCHAMDPSALVLIL